MMELQGLQATMIANNIELEEMTKKARRGLFRSGIT